MARVRSKKISEYEIQRTFHQWVSQQNDLLGFSVPNGLLSDGEAVAKERLVGLTAGIPDYICVTPIQTCFIEFKTEKGVLSKQQVEKIRTLVKLNKPVKVCRTPSEAMKFVNRYRRKNDDFMTSFTYLLYGSNIWKAFEIAKKIIFPYGAGRY